MNRAWRQAGMTCGIALGVALAVQGYAATEQNLSSTAILMEGFHWNSANGTWYETLKGRAADMKDLGVTHVWFPPATDAASKEGYLPRQLNVLDSSYGSESALKSAIAAMNAQGIQVVADVVINHRVGTQGWADFTNPTWDCRAVAKGDEWSGACGNADSGDAYAAARDLDHSQSTVQNDLKTWLGSRLKGVGFNGIRYDYASGYAPGYGKLYHDAMNPSFCVGEIWKDLDYNNVNAHRQQLMDYVDGTQGTCGAFDFTTKGLLNEALWEGEYWRLKDSTGRPAGGIGWWAQKMVTFVDNHDTGPSESCMSGQNHWPVPCEDVMQGYAYILTHPGIPMLYYPHVYDWNLRPSIKALVDVRKQAGLTSTSSVSIQRAETGLYAAIIDGKVAMKLGWVEWNPGTSWTLKASGDNYAVWTSGGSSSSQLKVTAKHSGKVLDVSYASTSNGANVHQWTYVGGSNQKWTLSDAGGGYYYIVAVHSGKCLDVAGISTADGANVHQWACVGGDNQKWLKVDAGDGYFTLKAKHSGKCLDVSAGSTTNGANVQQWSCASVDNQKWRFDAAN